MSTATLGASFSSERSDSSASTTSHSPAPQPALDPVDRTSPPTRYAGSSPQPRSAWTTMLDVVVLPCVPVTAIVGRSRVISPSRSARCSSRSPRSRAATRSGFSGGIALETTTSAPSGTFAASCPSLTLIPASRRYGESAARSEPLTSAPSARATSARPLIPAPPMPTKCRRRPAHGVAVLTPRHPSGRSMRLARLPGAVARGSRAVHRGGRTSRSVLREPVARRSVNGARPETWSRTDSV